MYQDWTPVVLGKKKPVNKPKITRPKLDEEAAPATVSNRVGKMIAEARIKKGLTQSELATRINEKVSVIRDYENGTAILTPLVKAKLSGTLGIKFPKPRRRRDSEDSD